MHSTKMRIRVHVADTRAWLASISWGDSRTTYTSEAMEIDTFTHENDDMLVLVAAGNDGADLDAADGYGVPFTVGSPATAKNVSILPVWRLLHVSTVDFSSAWGALLSQPEDSCG